jgi:hypothetical protein
LLYRLTGIEKLSFDLTGLLIGVKIKDSGLRIGGGRIDHDRNDY